MKRNLNFRVINLVFFCFLIHNVSSAQQKENILPQFLFPNFIKSKVLSKEGTAYQAEFNYNMVDEEMIFIRNGIYYGLENPLEVDTLFIQNRKFVPVNKAFYEVIPGKHMALFIQYKSKYASKETPTAYGMTSQVNDTRTFNNVKVGNQVRNIEIPDNVEVVSEEVFYVRLNGEFKKFTSERQLIKIFPEFETEIKDFIKKEHIVFSIREGVIKILLFLNSLKAM